MRVEIQISKPHTPGVAVKKQVYLSFGDSPGVTDPSHTPDSSVPGRELLMTAGCENQASLPELEDIVDLPNTQTQTQKAAKMSRQRNMSQMQEHNKIKKKMN